MKGLGAPTTGLATARAKPNSSGSAIVGCRDNRSDRGCKLRSDSGDEILQLDPPIGIVEHACRPGQAVVLAQCCSGVLGPK